MFIFILFILSFFCSKYLAQFILCKHLMEIKIRKDFH